MAAAAAAAAAAAVAADAESGMRIREKTHIEHMWSYPLGF